MPLHLSGKWLWSIAFNLNQVYNILKIIVDAEGRQSNLQNHCCQKLKANYDHVFWEKLLDHLTLSDYICSRQSDLSGFATNKCSDP